MTDAQLEGISKNIHQLQAQLVATRLALEAVILTHPRRADAAATFQMLAKRIDAHVASRDGFDSTQFQRPFDLAYDELLTFFRRPAEG